MGVVIRGSAAAVVIALKRSAAPTIEDALYIGERQRARILGRTARGVDINGRAFAPYSTAKIYVAPNSRLGGKSRAKVSEKSQRAATKRLFKKIARGESTSAGGSPYISRTGLSICFPGGYAQYKKWLGRAGVDLRGQNAPHMLQGIQIQATAGEAGSAKELRIGIYGPKAKLANAHNSGGGRVPRRRFFGVSASDRRAAAADLKIRVQERLRNART